MTLLDKALSYLGLMRLAEHEAKAQTFSDRLTASHNIIDELIVERDRAAATFKKAIIDLEKQSGEIGQLRDMVTVRNRLVIDLGAECEALRPDAQLWRDRADRERKRGQAKRKGSGQ